MLFSPRPTFEKVVAAPRWLAMLAVVSLATALLSGGFYATAVGQQVYIDQATHDPRLQSRELGEQQQRMTERIAQFAPYVVGVTSLIAEPLVCLVIAGLAFLIASAVGGQASFRQVFAVVVFAGVVRVVGLLVATPLKYFRQSATSRMDLSVLLPMLDEKTFLARFLGMIDLFWLWWLSLVAIGLAVAYRRRTEPVAAWLFGTYVAISLAAAAVMSLRG